ncbi:MAG: family 16 glycoside hydrolase, partial [Bacteroidota bacterium]
MQKLLLTTLTLLACTTLQAQDKLPPEATEFYTPVPPKVQSTAVTTPPPSDAIVLFGADGNTDELVQANTGGPVEWTVKDGVLTVKPGSGFIKTRRNFDDVQLHIEWRSPNEPDKKGQG